MRQLYILFVALIFAVSCRNINDCKPDKILIFNADSAFNFIEAQIKFGSRVPNSQAHDSCAVFLQKKLENFGANVIVQNAEVSRFDGKILKISNIIGEFYPEKKRRILLFAHWDSRYYADMATDSLSRNTPILGANDGASGVAVLLEIARQLSENEPQVGVDIIFFDAEDQGEPLYMHIFNEKSWCLGSQYWANHKHRADYKAFMGIGLDMVGAKNAIFQQEDNSRYFNNFAVKRFWKFAKDLGYDDYFSDEFSKGVLDDHVFVSQNAKIRSILIVDNNKHKQIPYFEQWHTQNDNIENIDKETLVTVGNVLLNYLFCLK